MVAKDDGHLKRKERDGEIRELHAVGRIRKMCDELVSHQGCLFAVRGQHEQPSMLYCTNNSNGWSRQVLTAG